MTATPMAANEIDSDSTAGAWSDPTEPMFILRGDDPVAFLMMVTWTAVREKLGNISQEQCAVAYWLANAMERWARAQGHDVEKTQQAWLSVLADAHTQLQATIAERSHSVVH